jgi:hypothetical protein
MFLSALFRKSSTASGSWHIFFSKVLFIRSKQQTNRSR